MASGGGNPTVEAANEATGVEPLNSAPGEPQTPQEPARKDEGIPLSLTSLPADCEPVVFPLSTQAKTDTYQDVSGLPDAQRFEELVKAIVHPSGPSRAEEMKTDSWREKYADVVKKLQEVVDDGKVNFYRVQTGKDKAEAYVVGLDIERERYLGVRIKGIEG